MVGSFADEQGLDVRPQVREEGGTARACGPLPVARGIDAGADAHGDALASPQVVAARDADAQDDGLTIDSRERAGCSTSPHMRCRRLAIGRGE